MGFPALDVRAPDIAGVVNQIGQQRDRLLKNRLSVAQGARAERTLGLDERRVDLAERKYSDTQMREERTGELIRDIFADTEGALESLAGYDSDAAAQIQGLMADIDALPYEQAERVRADLKAQNDEIGQMAQWILTATTENMFNARWQRVRGSSPEIAELMPENPDREWLGLRMAMAMSINEQNKLGMPQSGAGKVRADIDTGRLTLDQIGEQAEAGRAGEGAVTPTQQANNIEIDTARRRITELAANLEPGESLLDVVIELGAKSSDTGMPNSDYDPTIMRAWNNANQRKVGPDPDYDAFIASGATAAPVPVEEPVADAPEGPGVVDQALDFFGFGDDDPAAATAAAAPAAMRRMRGAVPPVVSGQPSAARGEQPTASATRTRSSFMPGGVGDVPLTADNLVDVTQLTKGKTYRVPSPDGGFDVVRWNGRAFEAVN